MGVEVMGGGTVDLWWAPLDESPPALGTEPGGNWSSIGEGFIDEDGFNSDFSNTINKVFVLKSTAPQRVYRTQEEPMFEFNLFESTMEALAIAMHGTENKVDGTIATNTVRRVPIKRGPIIQYSAMLFRTISPYAALGTEVWKLQGYLPSGVFTQVGSFKFYKEQVALPLTFELVESTGQTNTDHSLGYIEAQYA